MMVAETEGMSCGGSASKPAARDWAGRYGRSGKGLGQSTTNCIDNQGPTSNNQQDPDFAFLQDLLPAHRLANG
jgi:hypothetical protein